MDEKLCVYVCNCVLDGYLQPMFRYVTKSSKWQHDWIFTDRSFLRGIRCGWMIKKFEEFPVAAILKSSLKERWLLDDCKPLLHVLSSILRAFFHKFFYVFSNFFRLHCWGIAAVWLTFVVHKNLFKVPSYVIVSYWRPGDFVSVVNKVIRTWTSALWNTKQQQA